MDASFEFAQWLWEEVEFMKAEIRDNMPDWPWAFEGWPDMFPSCKIPPWDEKVNPA